jgi:hypothetical protein
MSAGMHARQAHAWGRSTCPVRVRAAGATCRAAQATRLHDVTAGAVAAFAAQAPSAVGHIGRLS